jgi:hypothetical protein
MELVIIALVGTALLMAAELREFVMGGRSISATAESSALRSALSPKLLMLSPRRKRSSISTTRRHEATRPEEDASIGA